ncbi:MAG: hypothetical protein V4697_01795 [Patescibacteria group bacterium]
MKIVAGDITSPANLSNIIIGMNTELGELSALGRQVLKDTLPPPELIDLGTVLTFQYDSARLIHMLICHHLGSGGWRNSDNYVRVGMDHIWSTLRFPHYSIVEIGKGEVGQRDGANAPKILEAIASSYLPVTLFIRGGDEITASEPMISPPQKLQFISGFSPKNGNLVTA